MHKDEEVVRITRDIVAIRRQLGLEPLEEKTVQCNRRYDDGDRCETDFKALYKGTKRIENYCRPCRYQLAKLGGQGL